MGPLRRQQGRSRPARRRGAAHRRGRGARGARRPAVAGVADGRSHDQPAAAVVVRPRALRAPRHQPVRRGRHPRRAVRAAGHHRPVLRRVRLRRRRAVQHPRAAGAGLARRADGRHLRARRRRRRDPRPLDHRREHQRTARSSRRARRARSDVDRPRRQRLLGLARDHAPTARRHRRVQRQPRRRRRADDRVRPAAQLGRLGLLRRQPARARRTRAREGLHPGLLHAGRRQRVLRARRPARRRHAARPAVHLPPGQLLVPRRRTTGPGTGGRRGRVRASNRAGPASCGRKGSRAASRCGR